MKKRSVKIAGHATSITLEDEFWVLLKDFAKKRELSINTLITHIDEERQSANLSSAIRLCLLADLEEQLADAKKANP